MNFLLAQITSNDQTILGVATLIVTAMAGAIVHLYYRDSSKNTELVSMVTREFTECKKDRDELRKMYCELNGRVNAARKGE